MASEIDSRSGLWDAWYEAEVGAPRMYGEATTARLAGEWLNNHHLFPNSARAGFLPYQIDLAWAFIYSMHRIGVVSSYHDSKKDFLLRHYATGSVRTEKTAVAQSLRIAGHCDNDIPANAHKI